MSSSVVTGSLPDGSTRGTIPLSVVLSWPPPNYIDPVRRGWMPALAIPLAVASTLMVAIRFWSRFTRQAGSLGIDDIFILASWIFAEVLTVVVIVGAEKYGYDRHVWDEPLDQHVPAALYGWIGQVAFLLTTCLCKIAILLFYRRMVSGTVGKKMLYASWAGIAFTAIYGIAFIIELCTSCQPLDAYWKSYDLNYKGPFKCRRPGASEPISGALSVASDFYAVVLPFLLVRNLQIPDRQRYGLYLVFGFGMIIVGCGIARTVYLDRVANRSYDTTWVGFDAFAASLLESQLSIIGACLPNLRKVFGAYFGESLSKVYSNLKNSRQKTFGSSKDSKNLSDREQDTMKEKNMTSVTEDIELTAFSEKMWRDPGTQGTLRSAADHEYFEKAYVKRFGSNTVGEDDLPKPEESAISKPSYPMFRHSVF